MALRTPRTAVLLNTRKGVVGAQQDEREAFIVTQQHVVSRAIPLDQLRLKQQRFGLAIGRHNRHRPRLRNHPLETPRKPVDLRIIGHPVLERTCLTNIKHIAAHIMHSVDTGL